MNEVNLELIQFAICGSPLGRIVLVARDKQLVSLDITTEGRTIIKKRLVGEYPKAIESTRPFEEVGRLLDRYFRGLKVDFDIPIDLRRMGDFSRRVLLEVKAIPFGCVRSYREIGQRLGYPMAARAVGQAVGRNPIPIVIPCHRVIRSDGGLGGFGMGLNLKERLLALEGVRLPQ